MNILNIRIDKYTRQQFSKLLDRGLDKPGQIKMSKINPEFIQRCQDDKKFTDVINSSDVNIADGRGILWAARYLTLPISNSKFIRFFQAIFQMFYTGLLIVFNPNYIKTPIPAAIPGVEAFKLTMEAASRNGAGVFLFGGTEIVLTKAVANLKEEFPDLNISGFMNGYDFQKNKNIKPVDEINKTNARVLIVALGSPRQEYWISENIGKLKNIKIAVGEGGTLDRIANPLQKAPVFINKIGLEWLWRLLFNKSKTENRNRFQRFWTAVPMFIARVVKWKVRYGQVKI